jgi:uncharacterized protein with NRDE domain
MCLIAFAWDCHPKYKLILAANRDEFYDRPAQAASFWVDQPSLLGGRDLKALGTWMAISKNGKFGALTNYRDPKNIREDVRSRGDLIPEYLGSSLLPIDFMAELQHSGDQFNGFNFLAGDFHSLFHFSNYENKINVVSPGVHGLSNALLDTSWPKVDRLKKQLVEVITHDFGHQDLLDLLEEDQVFSEELLPNTGVPREWERALSAIRIETEKYGTCVSTVLTVEHSGLVSFTERTLPVAGKIDKQVNFEFELNIK